MFIAPVVSKVSEQSLVTTECEIFMDNLYIFLGINK